jgi:hypothetical protein
MWIIPSPIPVHHPDLSGTFMAAAGHDKPLDNPSFKY